MQRQEEEMSEVQVQEHVQEQVTPTLVIIDSQGEMKQINLLSLNKKEISIGRSEDTNDISISDRFVSSSPHHGVLRVEGGRFYYADTNSSNGSHVTSASGDVFLKDSDDFVELSNQSTIRIGSMSDPNKRVLIWFLEMRRNQKISFKALTNNRISIGREAGNDIVLSHPSISRKHALITGTSEGDTLSDTESVSGVLVNGDPITKDVRLVDKDIIQISGFQLIYSGRCVYYISERRGTGIETINGYNGIGISARNIDKWVGSGDGKKQILHKADVEIKPGEFVAIIGGSGAGKSTIMNVLNGFDRNFTGEVYYNNINLKKNFQHLKGIIGYVPQEDIIYENLTLRKMLYYTARLRMLKDTDESEINHRIDNVLETLDLVQHQNTMIRKMSGGQKKRASIAVELLADPKLFFMDEPTSGLDPGTEKSLMNSMRRLCQEQDRTIIMVTHTTQSLHLCDKVIFMGQGGRVCFVGNVEEAKAFFENDDLTEIYNIMASDPAYWESKFNAQSELTSVAAGQEDLSGVRRTQVPVFRQLSTLTSRYVELIMNDRRKLLILMLEPILIGVLLFIVAGENLFDVFSDDPEIAANAYSQTKSIMFTLSCAAIWIGLFNSIQEICRERSILKREYMANLRLPVYMGSKVSIQALIGLIQAFLLTMTFLLLVEHFKNGGEISLYHDSLQTLFGGGAHLVGIGAYVEVILAVWVTILAAMSLGLIVSSIVKTGDKAMVVAPFLLIVQLLFSGFLFSLEGVGKLISNITISKWSVDALCTITNIGEINEAFHPVQADLDNESFRWDSGNLIMDIVIMLMMGILCIVISTLLLRSVAKDGR